jgi:hypothetical protein
MHWGHELRKKSELLHIKTGEEGLPEPSGQPSCWQCSRMVLEAGLAGVWLLHAEGWRRYTPEEFHRLTLDNNNLPWRRK